jgi:DNA-binding PadR family transcriptional regulator
VNINKSRFTNAELAILSLVAEQPVYGYQIEQIIQERGMREWTEIGFSSIYYLLNKLEKKGWITGHLQNAIHQGPARRVFSITPFGLRICRQETLLALSEPQSSASHFQFGLANLPLLDHTETLNALKHYEETLIQKKKDLELKKNSYGNSIPAHMKALFDHSLQLIQAELSWVKKFILTHDKDE